MTACNGCGVCCDPVVLPFDRLTAAANPGCDPGDRRWLLEDITVMPYRVGAARRPDMVANQLSGSDGGEPIARFGGFYRCRWFDETSRVCTNYEDRPPICSGYPWQGGRLQPMAALPAECSFNADVGRPVAVFIRQ